MVKPPQFGKNWTWATSDPHVAELTEQRLETTYKLDLPQSCFNGSCKYNKMQFFLKINSMNLLFSNMKRTTQRLHTQSVLLERSRREEADQSNEQGSEAPGEPRDLFSTARGECWAC
jgi:hypothetical protein